MPSQYDPTKHHRGSIRLRGYDYTSAGAYFVTIVTHDRECTFDNIVFRRVVEYNWQQIPRHFPNVELDEWVVMPNHIHGIIIIVNDERNDARRGEALPQGVSKRTPIAISENDSNQNLERGNASPQQSPERVAKRTPIAISENDSNQNLERGNASPLHGVERGSLGAIVGNFKSITTRRINKIRHSRGISIWQRNYYEHIVRDEHDFNRIRAYIIANPAQWTTDRENVIACSRVSSTDEEQWYSRLVSD